MRTRPLPLRFNPPPNWPAPPSARWVPGPGWRPDPAWGPAPVGWPLWVRVRAGTGSRRRRLTGSLAAVAVGMLLAGAVLATGPTPPPAAARSGAAAQSGAASPAARPASPAARRAGLGQPARDGRFEFVVRRVVYRETIGEGLLADDAQGRFVILYVDVRNIGAEAKTFGGSPQRLYDMQGREFEPSTALFRLPDWGKSFLENINPGNRVVGAPLVFDVPPDARLDRVRLHDGLFSGGVDVSLRGR